MRSYKTLFRLITEPIKLLSPGFSLKASACVLLIAIHTTTAIPGFSQDSTKNLIAKFSTTVSGIQIFEKESPPIHIPNSIRLRRISSPTAPSDFTYGTDNPLRHGAYYVRARAEAIYRSLKFQLDIYGAHRGVSYGIFNTSNSIVYPVFYLEGKDSFQIFKKNIVVTGKAGSFLNHREDEGLILYNVDTEGLSFDASIDGWSFGYSFFGDLYHGIGLNIDDFHSIRFQKKFTGRHFTDIGVSLNTVAPPLAPIKDNLIFNLNAQRSFQCGKVYFQLGYRTKNNSDPLFDSGIANQAGLLIGILVKHELRKWKINNQLEMRYYGKSFNAARWSQDLRYRKALSVSPLYGNTIGEHLYPLRKYETPFSQWAVFTEYQGSDIGGINLTGDIRYLVSRKFELGIDYDIFQLFKGVDTVNASGNNENFLYSFFTLSFLYTLRSNLSAGVMFTNKGMNLDVGYPTLYQNRTPFVGFKLLANFEFR